MVGDCTIILCVDNNICFQELIDGYGGGYGDRGFWWMGGAFYFTSRLAAPGVLCDALSLMLDAR